MTAEEARKLARGNTDTEALQRLIDDIDECIKEACSDGNFRTCAGLWYGKRTFASAVCSHYRSLGYTVTADPHNTYTDIEISWE
jgi:hypothetical protein